MPTDYSNDPFDFSVGTLWSADGDEIILNWEKCPR